MKKLPPPPPPSLVWSQLIVCPDTFRVATPADGHKSGCCSGSSKDPGGSERSTLLAATMLFWISSDFPECLSHQIRHEFFIETFLMDHMS